MYVTITIRELFILSQKEEINEKRRERETKRDLLEVIVIVT